MSGNGTQVLRFTLGEEEYCVPIDYVAEIVDEGEIRSLPDTDPHVVGITDLRGQATTIVDPCERLEIDTSELLTDGGRVQNRIIVFDADALGTESVMGWLVSGVNEVTTVTDEVLDADSVGDSDLLRGLIKNDDGFTVWLDPQAFAI